MSDDRLPEPWMRGPLDGVEPLVAPLFYCFAQVREDLETHTAGLTDEDAWRRIGSLPPLGFQLRHIAGSVDRLTAYLMDQTLEPEQMAFLKQEATPGASLAELLAALDRALTYTQERLKTLDPAAIHEPRYIGRKRLPSTVLGLWSTSPSTLSGIWGRRSRRRSCCAAERLDVEYFA